MSFALHIFLIICLISVSFVVIEFIFRFIQLKILKHKFRYGVIYKGQKCVIMKWYNPLDSRKRVKILCSGFNHTMVEITDINPVIIKCPNYILNYEKL